MKKKLLIAVLLVLALLSSLFVFAGCNTKLSDEEAWAEFDKAMAESIEYLDNQSYFVKYKYKEGELTVTQKLNVIYGNDKIDDFVIVNKGVDKASKIRTEYVNSYFGYSLRSGVKPKKAVKEDYKIGWLDTNGAFYEDSDIDEFFSLETGDTYHGKEISSDEEINKYTLAYVLGTLDGINKDNASLVSATKNGTVITLSFIVEADGLYYSRYNSKSNCLTVRMTVGRISKIFSADENEPAYFINYAGPNFTVPSYDA